MPSCVLAYSGGLSLIRAITFGNQNCEIVSVGRIADIARGRLFSDPAADTRAIRMVKSGHYALTNKKDGKTVVTGTIDFSADGKTRTLRTEMTDASGKKQTSIAVYDRQ